MNQPWSEMDLVLLSNAVWLLAAMSVVLAAVGVIGFVALVLAEWKQGVRASPSRRRFAAGSARRAMC
jgi:Na+/H+ antiporter NhaB